jgi:hypothetical protein
LRQFNDYVNANKATERRSSWYISLESREAMTKQQELTPSQHTQSRNAYAPSSESRQNLSHSALSWQLLSLRLDTAWATSSSPTRRCGCRDKGQRRSERITRNRSVETLQGRYEGRKRVRNCSITGDQMQQITGRMRITFAFSLILTLDFGRCYTLCPKAVHWNTYW